MGAMHYTAIRWDKNSPNSTVLIGMPRIDGSYVGSWTYLLVKVPGGKWMWVATFAYDDDTIPAGRGEREGRRLHHGGTSEKLYDTEREAALAADAYHGRQRHISVLDGTRNPFWDVVERTWAEYDAQR